MEREMEMQWFINEPSHLKLLHLIVTHILKSYLGIIPTIIAHTVLILH